MASSQLYPPGEVRVPMPEIEQYSGFIQEERKKFKLAWLEATASSQSGKPLIQRVPPVLTGIKEDFRKYFEPRLVAIGPLHHGNPKLERAEQSKLRLAALFVYESETTDQALFNKIMDEITYLKKYYKPDDIKDYCDDDKLAWILFVDGCAILYAVHYGLQGKFTKADDVLTYAQAQLDFFLLENQIPYRVLRILIGSAKEPQKWEQSLTKFISVNLLTNVPPSEQNYTSLQSQKEVEEDSSRHDYSHLLERFRTKLLIGGKDDSSTSVIGSMLLSCGAGRSRKDRKTFRSIKELKERGIHIKPSKTNSLNNISFSCNILGRIMMPRLLVDDSTASKLMNLVALEMCPDFENDFAITSYLCFLDSLIDTAEDVKELRVTGMLHNYLGSDQQVAHLFNKMSRDLVVPPDQDIYGEVTDKIFNYCNNPWTTLMAQAFYTHFSSPWTFLAFVGVILGLMFSAIQAYFSLYPQYKTN